MAGYDINVIRSSHAIDDVVGRYVSLTTNGAEFQACCPFHDEKTPSFAVVPNKDFYHCFGCGAHGDIFDFVMAFEGVDFKTACKILSDGVEPSSQLTADSKRASKKVAVDYYAGIKPLIYDSPPLLVVGEQMAPVFNPKRADDPNKRFVRYTPSMVFNYFDATGLLIGCVIRVDINSKTKITPTLQYCVLPDGERGWCHRPFDEPRILYNLFDLMRCDLPVIVCEGEKAVDSAQRLVGGDYICVTWPGGTNGISKVDWSVLKGRRVLVWPDMDEPGINAVLGIDNNGVYKKGVCDYALDAGAVDVNYLALDESKDKGWDAADAEVEGCDKKQVYQWIKSQITPYAITTNTDAERQLLMGGEADFNDYTPQEAAPERWQDNLQLTKNGGIRPMVSNIVLILSNDVVFKDAMAYCDLSYRILKQKKMLPNMNTGEWSDDDTAHVVNYLGLKYKLDPPDQKISKALVVVSQYQRFHPIREYLKNIKWDGVSRINSWLIDVFGAVPKNENKEAGREYLARVGRYFLMGAVARVMQPPVKMDNVLILEGQQGAGKSTACDVLFGDWFTDSPIPIGDKDAYQIIQGRWGCELAELDSFNKAESTSAKNFFSSKSDRYRMSYGVHAKDNPRQCVFIGTTNQDEYLKDYTGNRRYWPVYCTHVDVSLLRELRDQLWAEALFFYEQGVGKQSRDKSDRWWPDIEENPLFEAEQDARLQVDPWQHLIEDFLYKNIFDYVTSTDLISGAIGKDGAHVTRADQNRVSPIMHVLGWKNKKRRIDIEGAAKKQPRHVYVKPDSWNQSLNCAPFPIDEEELSDF